VALAATGFIVLLPTIWRDEPSEALGKALAVASAAAAATQTAGLLASVRAPERPVPGWRLAAAPGAYRIRLSVEPLGPSDDAASARS
jgi:hypothetical protein